MQIIKLFVLLLAIGFGFVMYFSAGEKSIKKYCGDISKGSAITEIEKSITAKGFKSSSPESNLLVIHDPSTMGRFMCQVNYENGAVVSTKYFHND